MADAPRSPVTKLPLLGNGVAGAQLRQAWVTSRCAQAAAGSPLPGPQRVLGQTPEYIGRLPQFPQDVGEPWGPRAMGVGPGNQSDRHQRRFLKKGFFN